MLNVAAGNSRDHFHEFIEKISLAKRRVDMNVVGWTVAETDRSEIIFVLADEKYHCLLLKNEILEEYTSFARCY